MADQPPRAIEERIATGGTPGAPNGPSGAGIKLPAQLATLRADPTKEYISGGVGGSGTWYQNWARTLPWAIDDTTLSFGDDLYDRMLLDPQVASVMNLFKASILEDGLTLAPAVDDADEPGYAQAKAICDAAVPMLDALTPDMDTVLWNLMDALALGNRVAEQVYRLDDVGGKQGLVLESLRVKPRHMTAFVVDSFMHLLGLVGFIPGVGAPVMQGYLLEPKNTPNLLPREKFCILSFRPVDNDPRGTSVLRAAFTAWSFKQQVLREHLKYLTQFASPSLIGYTAEMSQASFSQDILGNPILNPTTGLVQVATTPEEAMLASLVTMKNGTALAFPFGSKVDVLQNASDGGAFLDAIALYDSMIVKSILSQTLATEEGEHQARAAASVHQDVVDTIVRQAKRAVTRAFTWDVLRPWVAYNYGIEAARTLTPKATLGHAEEPDLPVLWTAMATLQSSGYLAPSQYTTTDELLNLPPRLPNELPPTEQEKQQQAADTLKMQLDAKAQQPDDNAPQKGAA